MRTCIRTAATVLLVLTRPAAAQDVTPQRIRALAVNSLVDSLSGAIPVYFSPSVASRDAADLQALMIGCVTKYRDSIPALPEIELAILDSAAWMKVSSLPYGLPNNNATVSPIVVLVPQSAPAIFAHSSGIPPDQATHLFRVLALHELGHILMFGIVGVNRAAPWDEEHFPAWYYELTATYFALTCLSARPAAARLVRGSEDSLRAFPRPSSTRLDDVTKVLSTEGPGGTPYIFTPTGLAHFAWYQRLMNEAAGRIEERLGLGLVPLLRRQWRREGPVTTADIVRDLDSATPGLASWLKTYGAFP